MDGVSPRAVTLSLGLAGVPLPGSSGWNFPGGVRSPRWLLGPWDLRGGKFTLTAVNGFPGFPTQRNP